jgi:hypothetical protein
MHRHVSLALLALLALGLLPTAPARASELDVLKEEVRALREKIESLQTQTTTNLEQEIEEYLDESTAWKSAQGGGSLQGVTIHASFTSVVQGTVGLDRNRTVASGDVDLNFDFQVTDNLTLFIYLTANEGSSSGSTASNGSFPYQFGSVSTGMPPTVHMPIGGATFGSLTDGIGVNGTVPTDPGSITVYEAGIVHALPFADNKLYWEIGALDPRKRFLQNALSDDENTQTLNNNFDDSPSILWLSDATASRRTVFGVHMWISFGANKEFTLSWGWFNTPGSFFERGQLMVQFAWKGEIGGREMNVRAMGFVNEFFREGPPTGDGDTGGGVSWDWWVTDKVGVWVRAALNTGDVNPIETDYSGGVVLAGLISKRPDDVIGIAVGVVNTNKLVSVVAGLPEDSELTLEVYYKYMMEGGKLQISPHVIVVQDPGGGSSAWGKEDMLVIVGIRIHVPF